MPASTTLSPPDFIPTLARVTADWMSTMAPTPAMA